MSKKAWFALATIAFVLVLPSIINLDQGSAAEEKVTKPAYRTSIERNGMKLTPDWKDIREWSCPKPGTYLILYRCKAINNMAYNVLVSFRMKVNSKIVMQSGYNISWDNHYGNYTLHYVGVLKKGDLVSIKARADSSRGIPSHAIVIPFGESNHEALSIVQIADGLVWYQSGLLEEASRIDRQKKGE